MGVTTEPVEEKQTEHKTSKSTYGDRIIVCPLSFQHLNI